MSDEELPNLVANNMEIDDDSDPDNWSDAEVETDPVRCLFCEHQFKLIDLAIKHLEENHNINLVSLKSKFHMDQYSYIKMINCIRMNKTEAKELELAKTSFWEEDKYLKPVEFEYWLTFDFEALETEEDNEIICGLSEIDQLKRQVLNLTKQLAEKEALLEQGHEVMDAMRLSMQRFIESAAQEDVKEEHIKNCVGSIPLDSDEGYFSNYSHYGIHREMLSDDVRTSSYRDAILSNSDFLKDKTVLDVGCGTAILSMFASKAGAEVVVAIDNSDIIYNAMDIVRINNFSNIKLVKGRLEDTELPIDKFDIIISEWMGYFLLFEGMLDSIIYARDRHLKPGGTLMPNQANISLRGYGDEKAHKDFIQFWDNVYGFDMSNMRKEVLREAVIESCISDYILTTSNIIADFDLMRVDKNYSNFSFDFSLSALKDGMLTAFVGYFDTIFNLPNTVSFSTSPACEQTHWKQVVFYLEEPQQIHKDDIISGNITCRRSRKSLRSLAIAIKVFGKELKFSLD